MQVESDSADNQSVANEGEDALSVYRHLYPSISALFHDLECPVLFQCLAKTIPHLQSLLDRWIEFGRPQLDWPEVQAEASSSVTHKTTANEA